MGTFPFGPHGPETRSFDPTPNPTAPSAPGPLLGDGDQPAGGGAAASTGGSGGPFLSFTISLLMVPFVWMFWICLYPLAAIAGLFAGWIVSTLTAPIFPEDAHALMGVVAGYAVIVFMSRVEYKLAEQHALYRRSRHVVRLILVAVMIVPWIQVMIFGVAGKTQYILTMLTSPQLLLAQLADATNLAIVAVAVVGMHFLLTKAPNVRDFWHRRLRWLGLK